MMIIVIGESVGSVSHFTSAAPVKGRTTALSSPFGLTSTSHTVATTTSDGKTGAKNRIFRNSRPRNFWKNTTAANSESIHTGTVLPAT